MQNSGGATVLQAGTDSSGLNFPFLRLLNTNGTDALAGWGDGNVGPHLFVGAQDFSKPDGSTNHHGAGLAIRTPFVVNQENGVFFYNGPDHSTMAGSAITFYTSDTTDYGRGGLKFKTTNSGSVTTRMTITPTGNVGVGTTGPNAKLDVNQTVAGSAAILAESGGTNFLRILNLRVVSRTRIMQLMRFFMLAQIRVPGVQLMHRVLSNAAGADFAEWVDWPSSAAVPQMGSVVLFKGGYVVVSSPSTAAFVGNDNNKFQNPILVAFAGQLPVLVTGKVREGDLIIANGDGTAKALPRDQVTMAQARNAVWNGLGFV